MKRDTKPSKRRPLAYGPGLVSELARRLRAGGVEALKLALFDLLAVGVRLPAARGAR